MDRMQSLRVEANDDFASSQLPTASAVNDSETHHAYSPSFHLSPMRSGARCSITLGRSSEHAGSDGRPASYACLLFVISANHSLHMLADLSAHWC